MPNALFAVFYPLCILLSTSFAVIVLADISGQIDYDIYSSQQKLGEQTRVSSNVNRLNMMAAGYLFADDTVARLNLSNPIDANLSRLLDKDAPDMRPSRGYLQFNESTLDVSIRAWSLLHEHALIAINDRVKLAQPAIEEALYNAGTSSRCKRAVRLVFEGAKRLDSWAVKLINSWGSFPPIGLFEGTYSEVGSFHTCVNIAKNELIDHAHYCSITFRPVVPKRKDYELVIKREADDLLHLFGRNHVNSSTSSSPNNRTQAGSLHPTGQIVRDAFDVILEHAQYHHNVYYKWGTCWPIQCSPFDVKRMSKYMAKRNVLMHGPVKCYSRFSEDYEEPDSMESNSFNSSSRLNQTKLVISNWDKNDGIYIWKPHFNFGQKAAIVFMVALFTFIILMTITDILINHVPRLFRGLKSALKGQPEEIIKPKRSINSRSSQDNNNNNNDTTLNCMNVLDIIPSNSDHQKIPLKQVDSIPTNVVQQRPERSTFMGLVYDISIITNTRQFFAISESQLRNITCLDGIRCLTMVWIILQHTMLYNDWSAFGRTREIEKSIKSMIGQPLFNGTYLVDTFFLMSGLLSAFTAFRHCKGQVEKFKSLAYILHRWLRLTPQILITSLLFIILPTLSSGPHWYPITGELSENCIENWWINVLHLQAFIRTDKMCSFATWWISVDFFYHFVALAIIWVFLLVGHRIGFIAIIGLICSQVTWQMIKHYQMGLTPNFFSTIPQFGAMWTEMTIGFFWKPYNHCVPFFFGFYTGYLMSMKRKAIMKFLNPRVAVIGWSLSVSLLLIQSYSTYWWIVGEASYSKPVAAIFYAICPFIWTLSICWTIIACHHGYGGIIGRFLSLRVFIILGRASYQVYLSHFQVLFFFYGSQNFLLEPTPIVMLYIIIGNIVISTLYGIFLCIIFELPWLNLQKRLVKYF